LTRKLNLDRLPIIDGGPTGREVDPEYVSAIQDALGRITITKDMTTQNIERGRLRGAKRIDATIGTTETRVGHRLGTTLPPHWYSIHVKEGSEWVILIDESVTNAGTTHAHGLSAAPYAYWYNTKGTGMVWETAASPPDATNIYLTSSVNVDVDIYAFTKREILVWETRRPDSKFLYLAASVETDVDILVEA
jgi:hypothetical protein